MNGQRILRLHYATWLPDSCDTFLHRIRVAPAALASMSAQVMSASSLASWESLGISMCVFFSIVNFFILRNWTCALIPWYLVPAAKWIHYFLPKNREYFFIPNIWYQRPAKQAKSRAPLHSVSMDCAGGERSIDFPCELMENMVFQWRLDAKTHKHKQKISKITKVWEVDELQFNTSSIPGKLTRLGLGVPDHWELWVYINKYIYIYTY